MLAPKSSDEFLCILTRLIDAGYFGTVDRQELHQAAQEVTRAIKLASSCGTVPTACERILGSLFITAIEHQQPSTLLEPT